MVEIQEQLRVLVDLQKIDAEIYRLKKAAAAFPAERKKFEAEFERKKAVLKAREEELKARQLKQKEKEVDLNAREEKIKKLQTQLYQLKSNKEYAAMELEIRGLKADKSLLEEEILKLLDEVDAARDAVAQEKERVSVDEKRLREALEALHKEERQALDQAAELEQQRRAFLPRADARILAQYERLLKSRDGLALVPVRDGSCGGCHMGLPPQVVNEIQMQEKMIVCESCARMLYWAGG